MDYRKIFHYRAEYEEPVMRTPVPQQDDEVGDRLDNDEVETIMEEIFRIEDEYFGDIFPVDMNDISYRFTANLKERILKEIQVVKNQGLPDILSPIMLLYPFYTANAGEGQGTFLLMLKDLIEENIDAIKNDDLEFRGYPDEEEEEDGGEEE